MRTTDRERNDIIPVDAAIGVRTRPFRQRNSNKYLICKSFPNNCRNMANGHPFRICPQYNVDIDDYDDYENPGRDKRTEDL